jgi:hypothetical protein
LLLPPLAVALDHPDVDTGNFGARVGDALEFIVDA